MDPTKDNFTQPMSSKEILFESEISKDNYYRVLSISLKIFNQQPQYILSLTSNRNSQPTTI